MTVPCRNPSTHSILQSTYFTLFTVTAQGCMDQLVTNERLSDHTRFKWWKNPAEQTLWRWDSSEFDALWVSANRSTHDNSVHHSLTSAQKSPWLYQWGEGSSLASYLDCYNRVTIYTIWTYESHWKKHWSCMRCVESGRSQYTWFKVHLGLNTCAMVELWPNYTIAL